MYKIIAIGGKDYKLEYSIEASLYEECIEKMMNFFSKVYGSDEMSKHIDEVPEEQRENYEKNIIKSALSGFAGIPNTALTIFYAGLIKYHGNGKYGDKSICSKEDAKELIFEYIEEHREDGTGNFMDILNMCVEKMGEDGFFDLIGIKSMNGTEEETKEIPKMNREARRSKKKASEKSS